MTESLNFYDTIGRQYSQVREADPRVTEMLLRELALQPGKCIADVGAGTGNYALALAERGYHVRAVEPSQVMLSQARPHPQIQYSQGYAEELPLENAGVDAMICVNAIHHFRDLDRAVREMDRVCNEGRIVILTADVRLAESYWFNDYFPDVFDNNLLRFQPLNDLVVRLRRVSRRRVWITPLRIPHDFADLFCGAAPSLPFPNFPLVLVVIDLSLTALRRRRAPAAGEGSGNRRVSKALPRSAEKAGNGPRNSHFNVVAENLKRVAPHTDGAVGLS